MTTEQDNLTSKQSDYAVFLPAISGFYATFIGKQRATGNYVDPARMPANIKDMEQMNWLNSQRSLFPYRWSLYSAGHANLDLTKKDDSEDMVRNREPNSFLLGDSGGFQIAKGIWEGDWHAGSGCPKAQKRRETVLNWLDSIADYAMILDIPTWVIHDKAANRKIGNFKNAQELVDATKFNNDYFIKHRKGKTKFLNVLQGQNGADADIWYEKVKHYPFEGWAMGGLNMRDANLALRRLIIMRDEKLLEPGRDLIHYLGTSKLEWAVFATAIQRVLREHVNPNMTLTYDCASPFIATAKGQVYTQHVHRNNRFSYIMDKAMDDKRLSGSKAAWPWNSPVGERINMGDICWYAPGMLNRNNKEGKTSWDSFSYFLMMGHNVYQHIESVQRANALTDAACELYKPDPGTWIKNKKIGEFSYWVPKNIIYMVELVNRVFTSETPMSEIARAENLIADFNGKRTIKSSADAYNNLFEPDHGDDNDTGQIDSWLEEDVDELLKVIND